MITKLKYKANGVITPRIRCTKGSTYKGIKIEGFGKGLLIGWTYGHFHHVYRSLKISLMHRLMYLRIWPVYIEFWSRDCDCAESTQAYRFPTYWHVIKFVEEYAEWAEGPFAWHMISRRDYSSHKGEFRDRALEAFENGNGTRIII